MVSSNIHLSHFSDDGPVTPPALHSVRLMRPPLSHEEIIDTETRLLSIPPFLSPPHVCAPGEQDTTLLIQGVDRLNGLLLLHWIRRAVVNHVFRTNRLPTSIDLHPADHRYLISAHLPYRFFHCPNIRGKGTCPLRYVTSTAVSPGSIVCRTLT